MHKKAETYTEDILMSNVDCIAIELMGGLTSGLDHFFAASRLHYITYTTWATSRQYYKMLHWC